MATGSATIALAGDVMLGRDVAEAISREGFSYPWGNLLPRLWEPDLFLINLECALTSETREWGDSFKPFHFRAEPSAVQTLRIGRVVGGGRAGVPQHGADGVLARYDVAGP